MVAPPRLLETQKVYCTLVRNVFIHMKFMHMPLPPATLLWPLPSVFGSRWSYPLWLFSRKKRKSGKIIWDAPNVKKSNIQNNSLNIATF
jgi:hypothetical protein